jgi:hypothetical protein
VKPTLVVCEDGDEYTTRFARLLGHEVEFERAGTHAEASRLLAAGALGILLDLDFRRTNSVDLVDETGATRVGLSDGERRRLAEIQGILVLRALRGAGITAPAILFADLNEPSRGDYLVATLAPLAILPSSESLPAIAKHIRALATPKPVKP